MSKIKTILDINMRANSQVIIIPKDSYVEVTEEMAVYFCNEDIEQMPLKEQKKHKRIKKAVRTKAEDLLKSHLDHKNI